MGQNVSFQLNLPFDLTAACRSMAGATSLIYRERGGLTNEELLDRM